MNVATNVTVEQLGSKSVNTKFGAKPTFSFKAGGDWFSTGFKKAPIEAGDVVTFSYKETQYGKEADLASVSKGAASMAGAPTPAAMGSGNSTSPHAGGTPSYGGKGVFPIPALDGQRSIIRQNALTNAREVFVSNTILAKKVMADVDEVAAAIIELARKFEAYSAGDLDAQEVEAEMAAEAAARKAA